MKRHAAIGRRAFFARNPINQDTAGRLNLQLVDHGGMKGRNRAGRIEEKGQRRGIADPGGKYHPPVVQLYRNRYWLVGLTVTARGQEKTQKRNVKMHQAFCAKTLTRCNRSCTSSSEVWSNRRYHWPTE